MAAPAYSRTTSVRPSPSRRAFPPRRGTARSRSSPARPTAPAPAACRLPSASSGTCPPARLRRLPPCPAWFPPPVCCCRGGPPARRWAPTSRCRGAGTIRASIGPPSRWAAPSNVRLNACNASFTPSFLGLPRAATNSVFKLRCGPANGKPTRWNALSPHARICGATK